MPYKDQEKRRTCEKRSRKKHQEKHREKRKLAAREYRLKNKEKLTTYHHEKYLRNRDKRIRVSWETRIRWRYGITKEIYENFLLEQNHVCAICGRTNIGLKKLEIDHDHGTGKIRGLLCGRCNKVLGSMCESAILLKRMIAYLEYHKEKE